MSRVTDAIIGEKAYAVGSNHPMLDLTYGGQMGYAPNLTEWVSNQAYVRKNLICVLLEAPKFFELMPNPEKWVQVLKSLFELHAKTIEGLNAGLTVETDTHPVGGAGELQDEFTNVTRARSEPVFSWVEKYGKPIQTFLYQWITYGLMDPDTKYALVGTLDTSKRPTDMLADWYSASAIFIEPDPTHTKVMQSWIVTNMYPKETGAIEGRRDQTSPGEILTLSISFTGIAQYNLGSNVFAQTILDNINLVNANPNLRPAFIQNISSDVEAAATSSYKKSVEDIGSNAISKVAS